MARSEASKATNSVVMLPENGISLRPATATATTRTEYSVGTGVAPGARLVLAVYRFTAMFPKPEIYGLSLQMRRAAISIAANVAEGFAKRTKPEKARYLNIGEGSVEESRYYLILALILAQDLGYGDTQTLASLLDEVSRLLNAYVRAILASCF